jgi:hypothetical protein
MRLSVLDRLGQRDKQPVPRARHQTHWEEEEGAQSEHHAHNPRWGGCDNGEGRSLSPEEPGSKVFGSNVRNARFPRPFRASSNVIKYDGKTNLGIWLDDYRLACLAGGVDDDLFVIRFLPIYIANTTRAWLDHLPRNSIDSSEDLKETFIGNFQGTYVQPGNTLDLKGCRQKAGEGLRDYIRHFSQKYHELPSLGDADIISAFWSGTSCRSLLHKLGPRILQKQTYTFTKTTLNF